MNLQIKNRIYIFKFLFGEVGDGLLGQNKWQMHLDFSKKLKT